MQVMTNKKVKKIEATKPTLSAQYSTFTRKRKVAAYARVSTAKEEQENSFDAQVSYYTQKIQANPEWVFVEVYSDEGITGTNTKKREGFNRMIEDALAGKIDLILTKSVSRFARNTVDSLVTIRQLKEKGVEVFFEKEYIKIALYLVLTPDTGLFFVYCSICCGLVGVSELVHCGLSLICRLNLQADTEKYSKKFTDCLLCASPECAILYMD